MVLFAMITRVHDGMPLSASTDLDMHFELKDSKKHAKTLARKANQYPTRCSMRCGSHVVYLIKAGGVCFITVCEGTYSNVLAFCFLEEIQREFTMTFQTQDIQKARRPYSFIEFDTYIQKTKQRYNNTRSLSTRLNLSEMNEDLQINPPHIIQIDELGPEINVDIKTYKTGGPAKKFAPLSWLGITACLLSTVCAMLNLLRCVPFINFIDIDGETSGSVFAASGFFLAGVLNCVQCYLLLFPVKWRTVMTRASFGIIVVLIYFLRNLRNLWQVLFHICVAGLVLYQTVQRQLQKLPDYNV